MPIDADENEVRYRELLAEIDIAEAIIALIRISRDRQSIRERAEQISRACANAVALVPETSLGPEQETEIWNRVAPILRWLELRVAHTRSAELSIVNSTA